MTEPGRTWPPEPGTFRSPLGSLALARGTLDRATHRRGDDEWLAKAWADPQTQVLVIDDGQALIRFAENQTDLVLLPPAQAPDGPRFLLGVDPEDRAYFAVMAPLPPAEGLDGVEPAGLRRAGALLGDRDAGLLTHAVALANWHATHPHCPRCGALTDPVMSGASRVCRVDGSEHFPRTDPAVIMAVTDPDDRILLARGPDWGLRRMSILAGFVEPGESAERAVAREVAEETGITVGEIRYLGSQPWPLPRSLMLGFWAKAAGGQEIQVDSEEIAEAHWFSRTEMRAALDSGDLGLPGAVSIAHRIIEAWYGAALPSAWTSRIGPANPRS